MVQVKSLCGLGLVGRGRLLGEFGWGECGVGAWPGCGHLRKPRISNVGSDVARANGRRHGRPGWFPSARSSRSRALLGNRLIRASWAFG